MDPASTSQISEFLTASNARIDRQDEALATTAQAIQALVGQVSLLTTQVQQLISGTTQGEPAPAPEVIPAPVTASANLGVGRSVEPRLPPPTCYAGEPHLCRSFLAKCSLYFSLQPSLFSSEQAKVAFVITLLSGRAAQWGTTAWEKKLPCCSSFDLFSKELKKVFDRAASGREAARVLAELRQGNRSVADYSIEFRTLAAESGWNAEAQWDMFLHGLSDRLQDEIYSLDLPKTLDELVDLAIRVDSRLLRRESRMRQNRFPDPVPDTPVSPMAPEVGSVDPEPMQLGRSRLSVEEKRRRRTEGLCLYCGGAGHRVASCPVKVNTHQ